MKLSFSLAAAACLASSLAAAPAVELNTLSVTASTIDNKFTSRETEASGTAVVSGETVDKAHVENIQQVLQSIPGLTTELQGGDSLKIHIRGVENQMYMGEKPGVAVVIDGVPVFERTGRVNIDLDNIESIKVIKGGASYLFGDDALAGAVIITTKRGSKYAHNYIAGEAGSFGYQKLVGRTGYSGENFDAHVQISERKGDGYWEDSDYLAQYANGKLQYYVDDASDVTVGFEVSHREKDSHGTVKGVTAAEEDPKSVEGRDYTALYDVDLFKIFATYSREFGDRMNLMANLYQYNDDTQFLSGYVDYDINHDPVDDPHAKPYLNNYEQVQRGLKSELRQSLDDSAWMAGVDLRANTYKNRTSYAQPYATYGYNYRTREYEWTDYDNVGEERSRNETDENVYAAYGEYKYALTPDLTATANLRFDHIALDYSDDRGQNLEKDFDVYSWRLGAAYALNPMNALYANVSTGFRAPTISQLFAGSVSTWGETQNNPDLTPEKAYNYEVGVRGYLPAGLSYDAAVFCIDREDYIMSTSGNYGDTDSEEMYDNIGGMRNTGFELSLSSDYSKSLAFTIAYTLLYAEFTSYHNLGMELTPPRSRPTIVYYDATGNEVPRTSRHTLDISGTYNYENRAFLTAELFARSSYYADDLNVNRIPGYGVVNLLGTYNLKLGGVDMSLFARIDNLFDAYYYNTARASGDGNEDGVFDAEDISIGVNPGRVYTFGLSATF
jgi:iron complex outermembrane receptor protein